MITLMLNIGLCCFIGHGWRVGSLSDEIDLQSFQVYITHTKSA